MYAHYNIVSQGSGHIEFVSQIVTRSNVVKAKRMTLQLSEPTAISPEQDLRRPVPAQYPRQRLNAREQIMLLQSVMQQLSAGRNNPATARCPVRLESAKPSYPPP
ncbi:MULTISPECIES: hypothetical protein [unclassified Cohnella]|uniref:hypothetical protein n=1 Tax=unclassified Cohnella TaxID=2636738 RepID=UPI00117CD5A4|nr:MULTISPECIES: hypothetical protein [unclassified Cohnella]